MSSFNQSDCFISVLCSYSILKLVYDISSWTLFYISETEIDSQRSSPSRCAVTCSGHVIACATVLALAALLAVLAVGSIRTFDVALLAFRRNSQHVSSGIMSSLF